ncbi:RNA binding protein, heterogenous nuclear RNP-K like protein [Apophysomyces ossiformis]|uniref:RNA binding protein, heterogenous nuclear RNP-K like protein n=1 Tax=Apophysomyces ossiformis TaxID=679940 RepID=A0A8H7BER4_9FUNG|nr:RNA binding protein, heterogenous nuclear RNP-K like protein [Apophysomyces ossiformis]
MSVPETKLHPSNNELERDSLNELTLRALITSKEAGVVIGKGGKNVAELRESTGVKASVSQSVKGVQERILTVSGPLEGVAKAFASVARILTENNTNKSLSSTTDNTCTIRLLVSHNLMGSIIGRQGAKIKSIQDVSGARMTASKALLPQSTERIVEVRGVPSAVSMAISEIGQCLLEDKEKQHGTILYDPVASPMLKEHRASITRTGNGSDFTPSGEAGSHQRRISQSLEDEVKAQHISIPSDMVGCIIGKGGSKISEIRQLSGSRISIARVPDDETSERLFTIYGTAEANERALFLLYGELEKEKERRLNSVMRESVEEEQ